MSVFQKSFGVEVKNRGPSEIDFEQAGFRLPTKELPDYVVQGVPLALSVTIHAHHTHAEWARTYARQGKADLTVHRELAKLRAAGTIDDCHELHCLQMAIEKIARAYMLKHSKGDRSRYMLNHVVVNDFSQRYAQSPEWPSRFGAKRTLWSQVKQLAGAIEDLTPAVDRQARPSNVEYPWSDGKTLTTPLDVEFMKRFTFDRSFWTGLTDMLDDVSQALAG